MELFVKIYIGGNFMKYSNMLYFAIIGMFVATVSTYAMINENEGNYNYNYSGDENSHNFYIGNTVSKRRQKESVIHNEDELEAFRKGRLQPSNNYINSEQIKEFNKKNKKKSKSNCLSCFK